MNPQLAQRLDKILPHITDPAFLSSEGIGNEIACYIFDYPAAAELQVRAHVDFLCKRLTTHHKSVRTLHLDLLEVILRCLEKHPGDRPRDGAALADEVDRLDLTGWSLEDAAAWWREYRDDRQVALESQPTPTQLAVDVEKRR